MSESSSCSSVVFFSPSQHSEPRREVVVGEAKSSFVGDVAVRTVEDPEFLESRGRVNPCAVWELEAGGGVWLKQKCVGASGEVTL